MGIHFIKKFVSLVFGLLLCSCSYVQPEPTATPTLTPIPTNTFTAVPTKTPSPTYTLTPTKTITPTFTYTPTAISAIEFGELEIVPGGGFAFIPIVGYETEVEGSSVFMSDKKGTLIITLDGVTSYSGDQTKEEIIDEYLSKIAESGSGDFTKGESNFITIDSIEGVAFEISGVLFDSPLVGQAVIVTPSESQYLFALGISNTGQDKDRWEKEGKDVFLALLENIDFINTKDSSACPVANDDTYGYSKDNPIKVGGGWLDGPPRERAFLDSLRGPNGEVVSYERKRSVSHGDTILDEYEVSYSGKNVILYLDEYSYEEPKAPVGFICKEPIPFSSP